jgi:lambda family phage portal protein
MAKPRVRIRNGELVPGAPSVMAKYEGGSTAPRLRYRGSTLTGPNSPIANSLSTLQARSHNLIRNNAYASGAQESYVSNLVGSGIRPKWNDPDVQALWDSWAHVADADQLGSFYALQSLAASGQFGSGEAFGRFRYRRMEDGLPVPMQIQLIESAHLDHTYSRLFQNRLIKMGIEFDGIGRRRAYHFWQYHPHEKLTAQFNQRSAVPASEVVHMFRRTRPGQLRGVPELTSVILRLYEIDAMQDALLARQKFAQLFGAFVKRTGDSALGDEAGEFFGTQVSMGEEEPLTEFVPGAIHYLESGEEVTFSDPPDIGSSYESWLSTELRAVAKGAGITYEQLTGDLTKVNYSSIRAGLLEFRRRVEALQAHLMVSQFCRPIAAKWLDLAVATRRVNLPNYATQREQYLAIDWIAPRWQWVDPLKETTADILEIRAGLSPRSEKAAERGWSLEDIDKAIEASNASADSHGLILDSDPRRTAKTGVAVIRDDPTDPENATSQDEE